MYGLLARADGSRSAPVARTHLQAARPGQPAPGAARRSSWRRRCSGDWMHTDWALSGPQSLAKPRPARQHDTYAEQRPRSPGRWSDNKVRARSYVGPRGHRTLLCGGVEQSGNSRRAEATPARLEGLSIKGHYCSHDPSRRLSVGVTPRPMGAYGGGLRLESRQRVRRGRGRGINISAMHYTQQSCEKKVHEKVLEAGKRLAVGYR